MKAAILNLNHPFEETILKIAGGVITVSLVAYAYAVVGTIFNIASVKSLDDSIREHRAEIGSLEKRYLTTERTLTLERAESLGLMAVKDVSHVALEKPVLLTFNKSE